ESLTVDVDPRRDCTARGEFVFGGCAAAPHYALADAELLDLLEGGSVERESEPRHGRERDGQVTRAEEGAEAALHGIAAVDDDTTRQREACAAADADAVIL